MRDDQRRSIALIASSLYTQRGLLIRRSWSRCQWQPCLIASSIHPHFSQLFIHGLFGDVGAAMGLDLAIQTNVFARKGSLGQDVMGAKILLAGSMLRQRILLQRTQKSQNKCKTIVFSSFISLRGPLLCWGRWHTCRLETGVPVLGPVWITDYVRINGCVQVDNDALIPI